jgi:enterochelin esterase-like enzyme
MNNSVYKWDFEMISQNMIWCVIPFIEKLFPVYQTPDKRAFCGLSMGSMTTLFIYMHHAAVFDYYGAFSGGMAPGNAGYTLDDPHLQDVKLLIGCGEEDMAYNEMDRGVPPTIRALKANSIPYRPYFTTGAHDWFCWPQMFEQFATAVLWK